MRTIPIIVLAGLLAALSSCAGSPSTTPVSTLAASEVGQDQGSSQATEAGSATNTVNPSVTNIFGVKEVKIARNPDGSEVIEALGSEDATVEVSAGNFGVRFGNEGNKAEVQSGGGAAGGTGGATRQVQNQQQDE